MSSDILIAPSILSADFRNLEVEVKAAADAGADMMHCDIMDGVFVPNISYGPMIVDWVKKCSPVPLDVHLMIVDPIRYITQFRDAGADIITVHAEACPDLGAAIAAIEASDAQVGVSVNPDKPLDLFMPYLSKIDMVLIMSVYAGFGGQKFIPESIEKVRAVRAEAMRIGHDTLAVEIDGGINAETAVSCGEAGVDVFVAGSYVFGAPDYSERINAVRRAAALGRSIARTGSAGSR
jgi:ribulose-phosphate 3-epimerase